MVIGLAIIAASAYVYILNANAIDSTDSKVSVLGNDLDLNGPQAFWIIIGAAVIGLILFVLGIISLVIKPKPQPNQSLKGS